MEKDESEKVQTIQLTSKKLKKQWLISIALIVAGFAVVVFSVENEFLVSVGALLLMVGFTWLVITKIRIWWHHK